MKRRNVLGLLPALASTLALPPARAQEAAVLHIVVPTPPGGTNDGVARALQEPLQRLLKRTVIVEYKPGAAGSVGSAYVARSKPDGNTLLLNNNAVLINPLISREAGYAMADLKPLVVGGIGPLLLIANAQVPATDVKGFIAWARAQPKPVAYASAGGVGSLGHLAMVSFARAAGLDMLHIPYSGGGPAQQAVTSGEVACVLTSLNAALKGQVDAGRIRLLGIASAEPSPSAPGVPPIAQALPGFAIDAWFGLLAPARTDAALLAPVEQALLAALAMPQTKTVLTNIGVIPVAIGSGEFQAMVTRESRRWTELVRDERIAKE